MTSFFGHARRWEQISRLVDRGELSHALLFYGPDGIGKKRFAHELAEKILCRDERCVAQLRQGMYPELLVIEDDTMIKVEAIAQIQKFLSERPVFGEKKVVIVDDAHLMNHQSQNKFLKTLEEPPTFSHIILITSQIHQLLDTIRSRAMTVTFEPLPAELIYQHLPKAASETDRRIATDFSLGSFGKALEILEDSERKRIFFLPPEMFQAMIEYDYAKLLQQIKSVDKQYYPLLLDHLAIWLRDLALVRENRESRQVLYQAFRDSLIRQSQTIMATHIGPLSARIETAREQIEYHVNPEIATYAMLMDMQEEIHR
ncbi:MAG TPA: AAA family ATPase [Tissierellia bacterium]|nr:AAA family ATPase [Tissierellia bacterium]